MTSALRTIIIAVLMAFFICEPLYGLLGENATFFTAHSAGYGSMLVMAATLSLLLPLVLGGIVHLFSAIDARLGNLAFAAVVLLLVAIGASRYLAFAEVPFTLHLGVTLAISAVAAWLIASHESVRTFLLFASPAVLVFPALFLFFSPASALSASDEHEAGSVLISDPVPIVLVVFDELEIGAITTSGGEIDHVRFPNFARLQSMSTWYPNAMAASNATETAIPLIVSGLLENDTPTKAPTYKMHPNNLFTWLSGAYSINARERLTELCPPTECQPGNRYGPRHIPEDALVAFLHVVLPSELSARHLPPVTATWAGFLEASDNREWLSPKQDIERTVIDALSGLDRNALSFVHLLMPHVPYKFMPDGEYYLRDRSVHPDGVLPDTTWTEQEYLVQLGHHRYLMQAGYTDRLVGLMLDEIERQGKLDEALVIVTADHGVSFVPGAPRRRATIATFGDVFSVPLFIKYPGQTSAAVDHRSASSIDILPTIAGALGAQLPWTTPGFDLRAPEVLRAIVPLASNLRVRGADGWLDQREWSIELLGNTPTRDRQRAIFGEKTPLAEIGPRAGEMAGLELTGSASGYEVMSIDGETLYGDVSMESGFVPALLRAQTSAPDGTVVAIALNGELVASAIASTGPEGAGFVSALLPVSMFRDGSNTVGLYEVSNGQLREMPGPGKAVDTAVGEREEAAPYFDGDTVTYRKIPIGSNENFQIEVTLRSNAAPGTFFRISETTPPMPISGLFKVYEDRNQYSIGLKKSDGSIEYASIRLVPTTWNTIRVSYSPDHIEVRGGDQRPIRIAGEFEIRDLLVFGRGDAERFWRGWIERVTFTADGSETILFD